MSGTTDLGFVENWNGKKLHLEMLNSCMEYFIYIVDENGNESKDNLLEWDDKVNCLEDDEYGGYRFDDNAGLMVNLIQEGAGNKQTIENCRKIIDDWLAYAADACINVDKTPKTIAEKKDAILGELLQELMP